MDLLPTHHCFDDALDLAHAEYEIGKIHGFLLQHAPLDAWGSHEKVLAWTTTPARLEID
jgi:hypothetical protein